MKKILFWVLLVVIIAVLVITVINQKDKVELNVKSIENESILEPIDVAKVPVKEFSMTSFVDMVDGKPKPQFSLKEITVNKGDKVRIKITVTGGMHDFKIDEFGVYADTQLNEESIVEFTADKAGEFVYYCTKPGHRANGHWGTLKVLD